MEQPTGSLKDELSALLKLRVYNPMIRLNTADPNYFAGDEKLPLLSTPVLTNLIGAENARTVRKQLVRVCQSIGFGIGELEKVDTEQKAAPYWQQYSPKKE